MDRSQILLENEISIFKKLVSRRKHEVLQNFLVNWCSDVDFQKTQWTNTSRWRCSPNHHRLWKLNTGLQATWAMSFSTLPPDSRTLVSKWNTKLALIWKEDFGPLGNSPVLLLLSPGKTPLTTTVAKFLDTSVCGALDALTPASVRGLTLKDDVCQKRDVGYERNSHLQVESETCFSIYVKKRREREYNVNVIEHVSTAENKCVWAVRAAWRKWFAWKRLSFFLSFYRFIYTRNNSRGTARLQDCTRLCNSVSKGLCLIFTSSVYQCKQVSFGQYLSFEYAFCLSLFTGLQNTLQPLLKSSQNCYQWFLQFDCFTISGDFNIHIDNAEIKTTK